jgi:hypothetical protein
LGPQECAESPDVLHPQLIYYIFNLANL